MWELYDKLIEGIPEGILVADCCVGIGRCYVEAGGNLGMAMVFHEFNDAPDPVEVIGKPLKSIAALSKSWDFHQASIGVAAINAWYNRKGQVENLNHIYEKGNLGILSNFQDEIKGKKIAVIGHFKGIEQYRDICQLTVLERNMQPGDLPDSACEYILPEQDFVIITGSSLVNKTMPRLLELSKNACTILTGPTVVMSPIMFDYGADMLAGTLASDIEGVKRVIRQGGHVKMFKDTISRMRVLK